MASPSLFPVCVIQMYTSSNDKLSIRVDRGPKPIVQLKKDENHVQIYVPLDTSVNYQPIQTNIGLGYFVRLQRMQQQYKIILQHQHEKKPECVVYASSLSHEQEIKTTVKEVNCRVANMTIAGSNLEVNGVLKGTNLTFESTVGTLHVYAKITCTSSLQLHSQNIVLSTEALLSTNDFKVICRKLQIDGRIFPLEDEDDEQKMNVELSCGLVHIGVDGCIGASNEKDKKAVRLKPQKQVTAQIMSINIGGGLANYGKILAKDRIDISIGGNLISLSDGSLDSAGRGYNALKQLRRVENSNGCAPSSSFMHNAIQNENAGAVANLIENGVDLNDKISQSKSKRLTLRQTAMQQYKEARQKSHLNSYRERITLINALFAAHDWRRGTIAAAEIMANIGRNCDDCAQFSAKQLVLKIGGSGTVEKDSIWTSTWVEVEAEGNLNFHGQVKMRSLILHSKGQVLTTSEAILSFELFARVSCNSFDCDGMWCAGENLALDTKNNVRFSMNSYVESDKIEVDCGGACTADGTWQLTNAWIHVQGMLMIQANAKLFMEESANISALGLHFHGFCHVLDQLDLILQDSAHMFTCARLESHVLKLTCKAFCTIGGSVVANDFEAYVRQELITTSTGKVMVMNDGEVTTGTFKNDSLWQVEKNLKMTVGSMEQSEDGIIFVKCNLTANIHEQCRELFGGRIVSSFSLIKCNKEVIFEGLIRCNEMQISLPYVDESHMGLYGQVDIVAGSLTVNGNLLEQENIREPYRPGVTIACPLTAAAIIAPFASIHVAESAIVRLNGVKSYLPHEFNILVNAGALSTEKESCIASISSNSLMKPLEGEIDDNEETVKTEAIICASTFFHQGQIKCRAPEVNILAGCFVNQGRLTNIENKQNHVKDLFIQVTSLLLNNGIIASDVLEIVGEGVLENTNRIYAVESMDIRLSNFHNDDGLIESKNTMKLLAVSKEWTKLGGSIKAKKNIDVCANRLNMAVRNIQNLSIDKKLAFSAKTDLLLSSDIVDEAKELSIGCAAQQSVAIDCQMQIDRLEVLLGDTAQNCSQPVSFIISSGANILANTVIVTSKSDHLHILFDGSLQCNRLRFAGGIKRVTIVGAGHLECINLAAHTLKVSFEMYSLVKLDHVNCELFSIANDTIMRLEPCEGEDLTTIITEDVNVEGTLLVEKKLLIKSKAGSIRLNGPVIGSTPASELTCEANKIILKGQLANFKFAELYARETISIQNENIKNIDRLSIDCADLSLYNIDIESCKGTVISCDSMTVSGSAKLVGTGTESLTIYSTNIHAKMDIVGVEKVVIACKRSTILKGKMENVRLVDIDSKWINFGVEAIGIGDVKLTAWAISTNEQVQAEMIQITALTGFINNSALLASKCSIVAPFVLSLSSLSAISTPSTSIHSLCLCTRNDVIIQGTVFLWMVFDPINKQAGLSPNEMNAWKTTSALMRDRWNKSNIDADEILIGLKYISDLQPVKIKLSTENKVYESLSELSHRFHSTPVSLLNFSELVTLLCSARSLFALLSECNMNQKVGRKKSDSALYEALVPFKTGKYSKETNDLSDTDIGYVSRSSSEDLNTKSSGPRSPTTCDEPSTSFFSDDHLQQIEERVDEAENEETLKLDQATYEAMREEEELAEFEELEDELAMAEEGIIRTDYIVCREVNIYLAQLREKIRSFRAPRPKTTFPLQRMPSSNDLVMKKLQVKNAISSLDLRSFGSQSSLASIEFGNIPDFGSPLQFRETNNFQRSKIPLGSFRSPRKVGSRAGTPSLSSSRCSLNRWKE